MENQQLIDSLREQMSKLCGVFALSMVMFDHTDEDEILRFAVGSVTAVGSARSEGTFLVRDGLKRSDDGDRAFQDQLGALAGTDGPVTVPDTVWAWAYALRSVGGHAGFLVISADTEPPADQQFLYRLLAQQTGAALNSAALTGQERDSAAQLRHLNARLAAVNGRLTEAVADLERRRRTHERLTQVAASGAGESGIADVLHDLTGLPVAVEDRFGNLLAWAGPNRSVPYPRPHARQRSELLTDARRTGRPIRRHDRVVALAQPRDEVLGVLALIDPSHLAGEHEIFALEHAAVVLAMELAHRRGLAEAELRLRGDLVDDLLTGTDDESARFRAGALGHDLHQPHRALVMQWQGIADAEPIAGTIERLVTRELDAGVLLTRRSGAVVVLAPRPEHWGDRHR